MNVDILLSAAAVLWFPGAAILRLIGAPSIGDRASRIAIQLAAGLAFWPIILLWSSSLQLHWAPWVVRGIVGVAAAVAFFPRGRIRFVRSVTFSAVLLILILIVTGWTRLRAVAGVVLPPWVDSVHHTMLVRLFLMRGRVPATYDPFISGATAFYHWGFHAITAVVLWFLGRTDAFSVATAILSLGQWLNAATPLFVYAAAFALVGSRRAAIIAAALAGLVSYYPAYYVSWGRYTHLTGVLLLLAWIALAAAARRVTPGSVATAAIVAAGLTLVHVRLAFFAVTLTLVLLLRRRGRVVVLLAGVAACLLVMPWLVQMRHIAPHALAPEADARWTSPADVRANLLWVPHAAELLSTATAGLSGIANVGPLSWVARGLSFVWWVVVMVVATRRRRTRPLLFTYAVLALWCALTLLVINTTHLQFATNTSAAITAWVPVCLAAGALIGWAIGRARAAHFIALAVVVVLCCAIGVATLSNVVNPATVIAGPADVAALRWMQRTLPPSSTIVGRVQPWYGGAFIGVDGAYWASVLTGIHALPPPSLYAWSGSYGGMELFLARWRDEYPFVTRNTLAEAKKLGVTHVYFGRGAPAEAAPRMGNVVYQRDGVTIAAVR